MDKIKPKNYLWLLPSSLLTLTFFFALNASGLYVHNNINDTCILEKMEELNVEASSKYRFLSELSHITGGRILKYNASSGNGEVLLHRKVEDLDHYKINHYIQTMSFSVCTVHGELKSSSLISEENVNGLLFEDTDVSSGNSARLFMKKEPTLPGEYSEEQYLTVVTKDDKTSCTLRLSQFNSHGRVLTDPTFGVFKFSPDGRYLMYVAESIPDPQQQFFYEGSALSTSPVIGVRPIIIIYHVNSQTFQTVTQIPAHFSPGNLIWKPDSSGVVGVVWPNDLFSMGCPQCANRKNMLFVSDILSATETTSDDFVVLSPSTNKHLSFPKFTDSSGDILIYFENDIASTTLAVTPGTFQKSRRLIRMNFTQSVTVAMSSDGIVYAEPYIFTVVDQVFWPIVAENDETSFKGIYPIEEKVPDSISSNDGEIAYLNIFQREANRLAAVDLYSGQIAIHPESNVRYLDIVDKLILLMNTGNINRTPSVQIGLLIPPPPPPPTTTTVEPASSTITSSTTNAVPHTTTVLQTTSTIIDNTDNTSDEDTVSTTEGSGIVSTSSTTSLETTTTAINSSSTITSYVTATTNSYITTTIPEEVTSDLSTVFTTEATTSVTIDPCEDLLQELEHADISDDERFRRDVSDANTQIVDIIVETNEDSLENSNVAENGNSQISFGSSMPLHLLYVKFHDLIPPTATFDYVQEVITLFHEKQEEKEEKEVESSGDSIEGDFDQSEEENEESSGTEDDSEAHSTMNRPTEKNSVKKEMKSFLHRKFNSRFDKTGRQMSSSKYSWKSDGIKRLNNRILESSYQIESFHAIYVAPKHQENVPLIVIIHDGPHEQSTTSYSKQVNFFLAMNMAVLSVNYMGSTGMGDKSLESIMGFVSQNDVRDCHMAVLKILESKSEIDQTRIALIGHSYGGFIAAHLSIQYPSLYKAIALSNPIVNLASMASTSSMPDWVWQMLGKNYTHSSVATEIYLDAWNRSPLSQVDSLLAATLIFVGAKDQKVLPETQGIALHRDLSSRFIPTELYHYPDEGGHYESLQVIEHFLQKTLVWLHETWGSFQNDCVISTSTVSSRTSTTADSSTPADNGTNNPANANYLTATCVLLGMHIFTLTLWFHLKI